MKANLDDTEPASPKSAMQLTVLYRSLKAELDGLETINKNGESGVPDFASHLVRSREICDHLRHLAHALISEEEEGRSQLGKALQNDVLQMMVGINIRLVTLDRDVSTEGEAISKDVAMIQQMVKELSNLLGSVSEGIKHPHDA